MKAKCFDMLELGLKMKVSNKTKIDPCIFVKNYCIAICYVGDCCIFYKDKEKIVAILKNISKTLKKIDEGDVNSYLGMNIIKYPNGTITMIQPAVVHKILNSLGI